MGLTVPVLRDDTIVLRPPDLGDAAAITAAVQDPDIPRFTMVPSPYTIEDAARFIVHATASWRSGDAAPFVIVDAKTETLLGAIGLHDLGGALSVVRRARSVASSGRVVAARLRPSRWVRRGSVTGPAHIGYWVDAAARGRGVATRALRLVARWALDELGLPRVEVYVFVENERSQRVAARAGFAPQGVRTFAGHPTGRKELVVFSMVPGPDRTAGATAH